MNKEQNKNEAVLAALSYSKAELQQAESKINIILTMNSIFLAVWIAGLIFAFNDWNWAWGWVFPLFITLNFFSLLLLAHGMKARFVKAKSIFYFNDTKSGVTKDHINDYIESAETTIMINSQLTLRKYRMVNFSLFVTFLPLTLIFAKTLLTKPK